MVILALGKVEMEKSKVYADLLMLDQRRQASGEASASCRVEASTRCQKLWSRH